VSSQRGGTQTDRGETGAGRLRNPNRQSDSGPARSDRIPGETVLSRTPRLFSQPGALPTAVGRATRSSSRMMRVRSLPPRRSSPRHPGCTRLARAPALCPADLSAPPAGGLRPLPHPPGASGHLPPAHRRGRLSGPACLRDSGASGLSPLRPPETRVRPRALPALRGRDGRGVLVQGAGLLPLVRGATHGCPRGPTR
jgi:hypothetical protein